MDKLGIKINIDYPTAKEITAEFEKVFKNAKPEVKVDLDKKSINNIRSLISDITKNDKIDLKIDTNSAIKQLQKVNEELNKIRQMANTEINLGGMADAFKKTSQQAGNIKTSMDKAKGSVEENRSSLEEIARTYKEINDLTDRSANSSGDAKAAYDKQMNSLKSHLESLKNDYKELNGLSIIDQSDLDRAITQIGEMNIGMKQTAETKKTIKTGMTEYTKLLNEEFRIHKEIDTAEGKHKDSLNEQLSLVKNLQEEVKQRYNLERNLTKDQRNTLESLERQKQALREINSAKVEAKEVSNQQKNIYKELQKELKDIFKLEGEIASLQAKQNENIQTAKEEEKLTLYKEQLAVLQRLHDEKREQADAEGLITNAASESLEAIKKQHDAQSEVRDSTIRTNTEIAKQKQMYDEIYDSLKRVDGLNDNLARAGSTEANIIRDQIDAEVRKQNEIQETLETQNRVNEARRREIGYIQEAQAEQTQLANETSRGTQTDTYRSLQTVNTLNPIMVAEQARQVSQEVYREVADLDSQFVQIEKVADASEAETARFRESIFGFASDVGKSAVEYGTAVERWVTQGKELNEATELARQSMIGAFVGEVDEADMVDYLSIPARVWQDNLGRGVYEVNDILNTMNEVANNNAIEVTDLGEAYKKASQTAVQSGMSFEEMTGLITGANDATRMGGQVLGTALRNVNMNFSTISAELTASGERKAEFFRSINVPLTDSEGHLNNTYDIIKQLNTVWGDLSEQQQTTAAFYAAGKRHAPVLQAMVTNWDAVAKATGEANDQTSLLNKEQGSAYQEFAEQQDSIQYKAAQLKNNWTELLTTFSGGRAGVTEVIDVLNRGLERVIELVESPNFNRNLKWLLTAGTFGLVTLTANKFFKGVQGHVGNLINDAALLKTNLTGAFAALAGKQTKRQIQDLATTSTNVMGKTAKTTTRTAGSVMALGGRFLTAGKLLGGMLVPGLQFITIAASINELSKIMFDVDLWEEAKDMLGGVLSEGKSQMDELTEAMERQQKATKEFSETNFISGKTNSMFRDLDTIREKMGLSGAVADAEGSLKDYEVVVGDTLSKIAEDHGITLEELIDLNPDIEDENLIIPGQLITVSGTGKAKIEEWESLSPEEFKALQEELQLKIEEYGLEEANISLKINSQFDIEYAYDQLAEAVAEKAAQDTKKALEKYNEVLAESTGFDQTGSLRDVVLDETNGGAVWKDGGFKKVNNELGDLVDKGYATELGEITKAGEELLELGSGLVNGEVTTFNQYDQMDLDASKYYNSLKRLKEIEKDDGDFLKSYAHTSEEYKAQIKLRNQAIEDATKLRLNMLDNLDYIDPSATSDQYSSMKEFGNSGYLDSLGSIGMYTQQASSDIDEIIGYFDKLSEAGENTEGVVTEIPRHLLASLVEIVPELEGMPTDMLNEAWDKVDLSAIEKTADEASNTWMGKMGSALAEAGLGNEWVRFQENMSGGVAGTLELMNFLAEQTGRTHDELAVQFGVSNEAMLTYGDEIFNVMMKYDEVLQGMDREIITKYHLETDDGTINMDVIDAIHSLPEEVKAKFNLETDGGLVDLEKIDGIIEKVFQDEEFRHFAASFGIRVDEEGNGLESVELPELVNLLMQEGNEEMKKSFYASLGFKTDLDEYELFEQRLFLIDDFVANPSLNLNEDGFTASSEKALEALGMMNQKDITIEAFLEKTGFDASEIDLQKRLEYLEKLDIEYNPMMKLDQFTADELAIMATLGVINQQEAVVAADIDKSDFDAKQINILTELGILDTEEANPKIDGDKSGLDNKLTVAEASLDDFSKNIAEAIIKANTSAYDQERERIKNQNPITKTINFVSSVADDVKTFFGGGNKSVAIDTGKASSMAINPQVGRSFSQSVTSAVDGSNTSYATSSSGYTGNPRYNNSEPSRVDSDVWRYWSREMFSGLPLDSSMQDLDRSIQNANDNNKKLIPLYQQQIRLIDKQINFEKGMLNAQQSEMNSILGQLRKQGFKTSGNQVTNLSHAKGLSGDKADDATELLNQWKSLYETMEAARQTIKSLGQDKVSANNSIASAKEAIEEEKIQSELEKIEKRLKRTDGLLSTIANDTSIFSTKLGLLDGNDLELQLSINEEGINKSSANVKQLTDEFNRLATMQVNYADNAEQVQSQLESLKSEILANADSIIEYRRAIKDLEIERVASDFESFVNVLDSSIDRVSTNIDRLKEGLVSGGSLSGSLPGLNFDRRTELEKEYAERLNLENNLNTALDNYATKNVERSKKVANAQLTIEKQKYAELLNMANEYSQGKVSGSSIDGSIGITSATSKNTDHMKWQQDMLNTANAYQDVYSKMVSSYNKAMQEASTASERELLNHKMIIDQLGLQEQVYNDMIKANERAVKEAKEMLDDSSLSTEQRKTLEEMINEYESSTIDAQENIRDIISERFELEFDLMDKAITKAEEYTSQLNNVLDIAEAIGASSETLNGIHEAIYQSGLNEYATALKAIEKLQGDQSQFDVGSYQWNMIEEQIKDVQSNLSDLTIDILNANQQVLESGLEAIKEANEEMVLGTSLDDYSSFQDNWTSGLEKAYELERLMGDLAALEDQSLMKRLELMDRQESVTKSELEYAGMLIEAQQLREKLENINQERNVQTLQRDGQGNWQWGYVADQSEYDETNADLKDLQVEIEQFRKEQQSEYVSDMNDIIDNAASGDYSSMADLQKAIDEINARYSSVLEDGMKYYDTGKILDTYRQYLANNQAVVDKTDMGTGGISSEIESLSKAFSSSFLEISQDLGKVIGEEMTKALRNANVSGGNSSGVTIQNQTLSFPNVKSADGLEEAILSLPGAISQIVTGK